MCPRAIGSNHGSSGPGGPSVGFSFPKRAADMTMKSRGLGWSALPLLPPYRARHAVFADEAETLLDRRRGELRFAVWFSWAGVAWSLFFFRFGGVSEMGMVSSIRPAIMALPFALAACAAPAPRLMPLAESGPVEVTFNGASFIADLQPGPVLTISRDPAFDNFEGKLAKDVAQQFCVSRGRRVSAQAYGHFTSGTWQFKGACA